jgi:hypothetical protein
VEDKIASVDSKRSSFKLFIAEFKSSPDASRAFSSNYNYFRQPYSAVCPIYDASSKTQLHISFNIRPSSYYSRSNSKNSFCVQDTSQACICYKYKLCRALEILLTHAFNTHRRALTTAKHLLRNLAYHLGENMHRVAVDGVLSC